MFPLDLTLAVAILAGSPEAPVPEELNTLALRHSLAGVAVSLEIMDPRERRYMFARPEDFAADVKTIRRRYKELIDAPPECDSMRFPERDLINELLAFNRAYRLHLVAAQALYPPSHPQSDWYRQTIAETDQLYAVWDAARDARCGFYYITVRRQALKKLRDLVGAHSYYCGCLPPHVPVWRFRRID